MPDTHAEMGRSYRFSDRQVVVIQQWRDPYGVWMIRVRTSDFLPEGEESLAEQAFLARAEPLDIPIHLPE